MVAAAIGVSAAVGVAGSAMQASATSGAADKQVQANANSIDEQQREFNTIQGILQPYNDNGTNALTPYANLVGTNGAAAQQAAIQNVQQSPLYQAQMASGKQAILQSASATGGLRGGNTQLSLAGLGQQTLANTVQQQIGNLSGMAQLGLGAATQTGLAGQNAANGITNANNAFGAQIGQNNGQMVTAIGNGTSAITGALGTYAGLKSGGYHF
jgi:hypothetical protein